MRKKKVSDEYVKERLTEWAEWIKKGCDIGLGFSHRNILCRLKEEGGILVDAPGTKILASNPSAEEIEFLVVKLSSEHYVRAELLRHYYFNTIGHLQKAIGYGYKKSQYYLHLNAAHEWIKFHLSK